MGLSELLGRSDLCNSVAGYPDPSRKVLGQRQPGDRRVGRIYPVADLPSQQPVGSGFELTGLDRPLGKWLFIGVLQFAGASGRVHYRSVSRWRGLARLAARVSANLKTEWLTSCRAAYLVFSILKMLNRKVATRLSES